MRCIPETSEYRLSEAPFCLVDKAYSDRVNSIRSDAILLGEVNVKMTKQCSRQYRSPIREQQANQTKDKICDAAERLLLSNGYAKMTVSAIAQEAGVSTQTVYAVFGSKRGIIATTLDRAVRTSNIFEMHQHSLTSANIYEAMRLTAELVRQVHEQERPIFDLLRGAGALDPELALIENKRECSRKDIATDHLVQLLANAGPGTLRQDLSLTKAGDIFWSLTDRCIYKRLIQECNWESAEYANWLYETLTHSLLEHPAPADKLNPFSVSSF